MNLNLRPTCRKCQKKISGVAYSNRARTGYLCLHDFEEEEAYYKSLKVDKSEYKGKRRVGWDSD